MYDASIHLPDVATDHERRLASVSFWTAAIDEAIVNLANEKNPAKCRPEILPWLAYEASADFWDAAWTIDRQRYAISVQWEVHRHKGTRYALSRALSVLGVAASIKEWFEQDPPGIPGTFNVVAFVQEQIYQDLPLLSERLQKLSMEAITRTKPLSRHFSFQLGVGFTHARNVSAVQSQTQFARLPLSGSALKDFSVTPLTATTSTSLQLTRQSSSASPLKDFLTHQRAASVCVGLQMVRCQMETVL